MNLKKEIRNQIMAQYWVESRRKIDDWKVYYKIKHRVSSEVRDQVRDQVWEQVWWKILQEIKEGDLNES
jgi:hypothetical protein